MRGKLLLDPEDSVILKGIGILAIVFHNYFHLLSRARENEFDFDPQRVVALLGALGDPRLAVQALFSYLGHYGVQIFIFLSAYGLAVRYWDSRVSWAAFAWARVRKIYPMFLVAIALWAALMAVLGGRAELVRIAGENAGSLALLLLGVVNLVPGYGLPPIGPWWFVPFIMQFYCLWPLLKRFTARFGRYGLVGLSGASLVLLYTTNDALVRRWSINLLESPGGHLPELCLGIAVARYGYVPGSVCTAMAAVVFLASNAYAWCWPLSFISALVLMLWLYQRIRARARRVRVLARAGTCSMALFLVNGFVRLPFLGMAVQQKTWIAELLFGLAAGGCAWALAELITRQLPQTRGRAPGAGAARKAPGGVPV